MIFKNSYLEMNVDAFKILGVTDHYNGTCSILVELTNKNSTLIETLTGFEYENDKWETADIEKFITQKLSE